MTRRIPADLKTEINRRYADNTNGDISALDARVVAFDIVDSFIPMPLPTVGNRRFFLANTATGLQYGTLNFTDIDGIDDDEAFDGDLLIYAAAEGDRDAGYRPGRLTEISTTAGHARVAVTDTGAVVGDANNYNITITASGVEIGHSSLYKMLITPVGVEITRGTPTGLPRADVDMSPLTGAFLPPSGTTAQQPAATHEGQMRYDTDLRAYRLRDASGWFTLNAAALRGGGSSEYVLPDKLQVLADALTITHEHMEGWRGLPGMNTTGLERIYRWGFGEDRRQTGEGPTRTNGFGDVTGTWMAPNLAAGNYRFHPQAAEREWPGVKDFVVYFAGGVDSIRTWSPDGFGDYPLAADTAPGADLLFGIAVRSQETIDETSQRRAIIAIGDDDDPYGADNGGLIGHDPTYGVFLRAGDGGGSTITEPVTIEIPGRPVHPMRFHGEFGGLQIAENWFEIPVGVTEITITTQFRPNGNDQGSHDITYTIPSADSDVETELFPNLLPDFAGSLFRPRLRYRASDRRLFVVGGEINPASVHVVRAHYATTRTWTLAERYSETAIGTGDPHDRHGISSGLHYDYNQRGPQQILLYFHPADPNTTDADPELAVTAVVRNPDTGTQHAPITRALGRTMTACGWNGDIKIADATNMYRQFQAYQVDRARRLTDSDLTAMARGFDDSLNLWTNRVEDSTDITIAGLQSASAPSVKAINLRVNPTEDPAVAGTFTYAFTSAEIEAVAQGVDDGFRTLCLLIYDESSDNITTEFLSIPQAFSGDFIRGTPPVAFNLVDSSRADFQTSVKFRNPSGRSIEIEIVWIGTPPLANEIDIEITMRP